MSDLRPSVRATYDSRQTGWKYHVTTAVNDCPVAFQHAIPDPFARTIVHVSRWDMLRSLLRGLRVEVTIGGDPEVVNDVLELDDSALISGRTRAAAFRQSINERLREVANGG